MSDEAKVLPAVSMNQELTNAIYAAVDPAAIRAAIISEAEKQNAEVIATQRPRERRLRERLLKVQRRPKNRFPEPK